MELLLVFQESQDQPGYKPLFWKMHVHVSPYSSSVCLRHKLIRIIMKY